MWRSTAQPELTFTSNANNMNTNGTNLQLMSGTAGTATYTLAAPSGYVIESYQVGIVNGSHSNRGWDEQEFALPAACDDQDKVWVRFMPDYTSPLTGVASANDGTAVAEIFVTADKNLADDTQAPRLLS